MNVKITLSGLGGELDSVTLEGVNEVDDKIDEAVADMFKGITWAVGDVLSIVEID